MIGVVGGMGPYAGLDLVKKIFDLTNAGKDQEHLPVLLYSAPQLIGDRTAYLLGEIETNPADAIASCLNRMYQQDIRVAGIPCNTAHAPVIFDRILSLIPSDMKLLNMPDEVSRFIKTQYSGLNKVGILSTTGTWQFNLYPQKLETYGLTAIQLEREKQDEWVQQAIYHPEYGIKANSKLICSQAVERLMKASNWLIDQGAEIIISGCTEIPLALPMSHINNVPLIDATKVLAAALIKETFPEKLLSNWYER